MTDYKLMLLYGNTRGHLDVCRQMFRSELNNLKLFKCEQNISLGSFQNLSYKMCIQIIHIYCISLKRIWHIIADMS